jgi:hypothetical protein
MCGESEFDIYKIPRIQEKLYIDAKIRENNIFWSKRINLCQMNQLEKPICKNFQLIRGAFLKNRPHGFKPVAFLMLSALGLRVDAERLRPLGYGFEIFAS